MDDLWYNGKKYYEIPRKGLRLLEKDKIDRINELARKQKSEGLADHEKTEQHNLRQEYLTNFREFFRGQLENIEIVDDENQEDSPK